MSAPNPQRQKAARERIDSLFTHAANVWIIHYSCESFHDRPEGRSARITSIAVKKLSDAQTHSFSIHQIAERDKVPFGEIEQHYDELERRMLSDFYLFVGSYRNSQFVHWNMRDTGYGFAAIEHRYRVLGGDPPIIEDDRKTDLARLIIDIYGKDYTSHPRMENTIAQNDIRPLDFLTGAQEAAAFEARDFHKLHRSTLRKVDIFANLATLVKDRNLKTNTTWWEMNGGWLRSIYVLTVENKLLAFVATILGIGGPLLAGWWWLRSVAP